MEKHQCNRLKCVHCKKIFNRRENTERENNPLAIIYYVRESAKKGFLRKLWSWIC
jgi:hypothetical protein